MPVWLIVLLAVLGFIGIIILSFFFAACRINKQLDGLDGDSQKNKKSTTKK